MGMLFDCNSWISLFRYVKVISSLHKQCYSGTLYLVAKLAPDNRFKIVLLKMSLGKMATDILGKLQYFLQ